jgi:hypothetical protein
VDLVACGPVVVQRFSGLANPILGTVRSRYFSWVLWCISFLGGVPPFLFDTVPPMALTAIKWLGIVLFVSVGLYVLSVGENYIRNLIRRLRFEAALKAETRTFKDLVGKLSALHIKCGQCGKQGKYDLYQLIEDRGEDAKLSKWMKENCPHYRSGGIGIGGMGINDICGLRLQKPQK